MDGDVVVEDQTVAGADWIDSLHLKCVALQLVNRAAENIVSFALEFGSGAGGALFDRENFRVHPVGMRLGGGIFLNEFNVGTRPQRSTEADPGTSVAGREARR